MSAYGWLTLDQLKERAATALDEAHGAPKAETSHSTAWARKSREWSDLTDEIARREKEKVPYNLVQLGGPDPLSVVVS